MLVSGKVGVVVHDSPLLLYLVNNIYPESLEILPYQFESREYAIGLVDNSPLRKAINRQILEIINEPSWQDPVTRYMGNNP